jgi:hypothetical protein
MLALVSVRIFVFCASPVSENAKTHSTENPLDIVVCPYIVFAKVIKEEMMSAYLANQRA